MLVLFSINIIITKYSYNILNSFFIKIKESQARLIQAREFLKENLNSKSVKSLHPVQLNSKFLNNNQMFIWSLVSKQLFFIDCLWSYIQVFHFNFDGSSATPV
jgi:hypothetical protein